VALSSGTAQLAITEPAGTYRIAAQYTGDANYALSLPADEAKTAFTVTRAATSTTVTPGTAAVSYGQSVTFTATVSSTFGTPPDGSVQFLVNGVAYGSPVALSSGTAQLAITEPAGTYRIAAQYTGDANYALSLPADETKATLTVNPALGIQSLSVEKGIAERSFIQYLDVNFDQSVSSPGSVLQFLAAGLTGSRPNSFVELLWYGENLTASSTPQGSVNLFNTGTTASVTLTGNDLSINFGPKGITSLLTETGKSGTGSPNTTFGDGWYALGIDPTGNPSNGQTVWATLFRLLGDTTGNTTVTGPYTKPGTDAYNVFQAEGQSGSLLNADVNGDGAVNIQDFFDTVSAQGDSVGTTAPQSFPQFQLFGGAAGPGNAVAVTPNQVQALVPQAIAGWRAAGLDAADVQRLESVQVQLGNLGTSILGLETAGVITINQTAAGYNWYVGAGSGSSQAFGLAGPDGEAIARTGSPAAGEVDLLTVLEHEMGHVIGLPDNAQAGDLMDITLGLGVRREPTGADVATIAQTSSTAVLAAPAAQATAHILTSDVQGRQPTPLHGSVAQATVDAALASMLGAAIGNGDVLNPTVRAATPAQAVGRFSVIGVTTKGKDQVHQSPLPYPNRLLSSLFTSKNRRPGQSSVLGPKALGEEQGN
jgi:hypothetical protein